MKRGTIDHPKTQELMDLLDIAPFEAVGVLECLWHFTARYAPSGEIGKWTNKQIGKYLGWKGDADQLVAALVSCRWLDEDEEVRLVVHDWDQHADDTVHTTLARAARLFANGEKPKIVRMNQRDRERLGPLLDAEHAKYMERAKARVERQPSASSTRASKRRSVTKSAQPVPKPCLSLSLAIPKPEPKPEPVNAAPSDAADDSRSNSVIWAEEYKREYHVAVNAIIDRLDGKDHGLLKKLGAQARAPDIARLVFRAYLKCKLPQFVNSGHPVNLLYLNRNRFFDEAKPNKLFEPEETDDATDEDFQTPDEGGFDSGPADEDFGAGAPVR